MRNILLLTLVMAGLCFGLSQTALADCVQTGNTPGGGNIINCPAPIQDGQLGLTSNPSTTEFADEVNIPEGGGVTSNVDSAVETEGGNDVVTTSGNVTGPNNAIFTGGDDDMITVNGGHLIGLGSQAVQSGPGNDMVIINGGLLEGDTQVIFTASGDDKIIINGGTLRGLGPGADVLFASSGNDTVELNGGIYLSGEDLVIDLDTQNDTLTFGADIDLGGFVDCGSGFDTLIFAMDVPIERLNFFTNEILSANPSGDTIEINGITYEWEDCDLLVADLNGVRFVRPIPTLSQWGLIAMAGLIGFAGLLVIRKRALYN